MIISFIFWIRNGNIDREIFSTFCIWSYRIQCKIDDIINYIKIVVNKILRYLQILSKDCEWNYCCPPYGFVLKFDVNLYCPNFVALMRLLCCSHMESNFWNSRDSQYLLLRSNYLYYATCIFLILIWNFTTSLSNESYVEFVSLLSFFSAINWLNCILLSFWSSIGCDCITWKDNYY